MKTFLKIAGITLGIGALSLAYAAPPQLGKERRIPTMVPKAQNPDLTVELWGSCHNEPKGVKTVKIYAKVKNLTNAQAGAAFVTTISAQVFKGPNQPLNYKWAWHHTTNGLAGLGSEQVLNETVHFGAPFPSLQVKVQGIVDYNDDIPEINENNNKGKRTIYCP